MSLWQFLADHAENLKGLAAVAAIVVGSGGGAALATKGMEMRSARKVRDEGDRRARVASTLALAEHLENYAFWCAGEIYVTREAAKKEAAGEQPSVALIMQIPDYPAVPDAVDWSTIDATLSPRAYAFRLRVLISQSAVESSETVSLAQRSWYAFREAARNGRDALNVAAALRTEAKLPPVSWFELSWPFRDFLEEAWQNVDARLPEIAAITERTQLSKIAERDARTDNMEREESIAPEPVPLRWSRLWRR